MNLSKSQGPLSNRWSPDLTKERLIAKVLDTLHTRVSRDHLQLLQVNDLLPNSLAGSTLTYPAITFMLGKDRFQLRSHQSLARQNQYQNFELRHNCNPSNIQFDYAFSPRSAKHLWQVHNRGDNFQFALYEAPDRPDFDLPKQSRNLGMQFIQRIAGSMSQEQRNLFSQMILPPSNH
jgi:hypothetical protein